MSQSDILSSAVARTTKPLSRLADTLPTEVAVYIDADKL